MNEPWTDEEVDLTIDSYFQMCVKELKGIKYKKSEHRKNLAPLLPRRTEKAIEYKYQNISAVLAKNEMYFIKGYTPKANFQRTLEERTMHFLENRVDIRESYLSLFQKNVLEVIKSLDFSTLLQPETSQLASEPNTIYKTNPRKVDFLEVEKKNIDIGNEGEKVVFEYEQWYLNQSSKHQLANKVEWVSKTQGDGAGYDIRSYDINGNEKYIEVKSTTQGVSTPIFFSRNELEFSKTNSSSFWLYRLYDLGGTPKMFVRNGSIDSMCTAIPVSFKGYFKH